VRIKIQEMQEFPHSFVETWSKFLKAVKKL